MSRIFVLGDMHLPFVNWDVVEAARDYCKWYKPDLIIQIGDFIDSYNWSRYQRDPDSPNAETEWAMVETAVHNVHKMFGPSIPWIIRYGNHDLRAMLRAFEVNIPKKMIKTLDDVFDYDNWNWFVEPKPFVKDGIVYIHGDEMPGNAWQKSQRVGRSIIQGHDHMGYLHYINTFDHQIFGMSVGCLIDAQSIAARYARKNLMRCFLGFATVTDGVPQLIPFNDKPQKK